MVINMDKLMKIIGYHFNNPDLLRMALTHKSYANENKQESYERLEFLGDSILSYVVSIYLYEQFPDESEGGLSRIRASLVCEKALEQYTKKLELGEHLILNRGEEITGGRQRTSILADIFESIVAAIFLDGGISPAQDFIFHNLGDALQMAQEGKNAFRDYKTELQEILQQDDENVVYELLSQETGDNNLSIFTMQVSFRGEALAEGTGKSKKEAEQQAAEHAVLKLLNEKK